MGDADRWDVVMAKQYKVWIVVEELDEDEDGQDVDCLDFSSTGTFDTLEEAKRFATMLNNQAVLDGE